MPNPLHVMPTSVSARPEPVLVRLGRLSFEKGQGMLLEAWAEVAPRHPAWRLRLYGTGLEEGALRRRTAELGFDASVELPGATADLESALTGASVFALSSREEGFPMPIIEAMAYGLPTAAALDRLMDDARLRDALGEAARASVRRYAPDAVIDRWERQFALVDLRSSTSV